MVKVEELKEALREKEIWVLEEKRFGGEDAQLLVKKRHHYILQLITFNEVQFFVFHCVYPTVADAVPLELVDMLNKELALIKVWRHWEHNDTLLFTFYIVASSPEAGAEGLLQFEELLKPAIEAVEKWEKEWWEQHKKKRG